MKDMWVYDSNSKDFMTFEKFTRLYDLDYDEAEEKKKSGWTLEEIRKGIKFVDELKKFM